MLTVTELARIASRYATRMADAMIAACIRHANEVDFPLVIPEKTEQRKRRKRKKRKKRNKRPAELDAELSNEEWRVMVESNRASDAAWRKS